MKSIARRQFLVTASAATTALTLAPAVWGQTGLPVKLVVGFPAGGAADALARALAEPLRASLGATVVVDNRPGAGGRIAAEQVKSAPANGTSLLISPASVITMAPHLFKSTRYELVRDFTPVTSLARLDLALYAGPAVPDSVKTVDDMVKWLQDNPKNKSCGIPGLGSTPHLAALLIGRQTKLDWQLVPYQGDAPVFMALLGGEIPVAVSSLAGGMAHLRAGKLRLLATTGSQRTGFFPNVPTLSQSGLPEVVVEDLHGVFVPKQTPTAIVSALNQAIRSALQSKEVADMLQRLSLERADASAEDFNHTLVADSDRWGRTVRALNLSME